jgi:hypothetical protein
MDPRIDIFEPEVMVKTLRKSGTDTPSIRFLDEGHGWKNYRTIYFMHSKKQSF